MLFGLGPVEFAVIVAVGCAVEVVLLWAATGLADLPDVRWGRLIPTGVGVFLSLVAAGWGIASSVGALQTPSATDGRTPALAAAGLTLLAALVLPGLVYPPALPVTVRRGLWVSVIQWLLRLFLYVFILALVMVVIAVVQIVRGP
ncbi:MAG: hypothetical protein ACRC33_07845 [Gemmataceae bacterium]